MFKNTRAFFAALMAQLAPFMQNRRGNISATVIGVTIAAIILGSVGIPILLGVNTTGWSAQDVTIFAILPTFLIVGLLVAVARDMGLA